MFFQISIFFSFQVFETVSSNNFPFCRALNMALTTDKQNLQMDRKARETGVELWSLWTLTC